TDEEFRAFLKERKIRPEEVDPTSRGDFAAIRYAPPDNPMQSPGMHLYTTLFRHAYGLRMMRERTEIVRKFLPHALIGANFSPHHGPLYLGSVHQWVHSFRQGVLTLPWDEDYAWSVPIGSPQASSIAIDLLRSAIRKQPNAPIQHYVMAHAPGTNPRAWRRQFYAAVAHGVRIFNLFDLVPLAGAPTENYVNDPAMFQAVRNALHELGSFEDLLQEAHRHPTAAALWFSEIGDVWNDHDPPFGAELRSLYLGLSHQHLPLDIVVEEDAFDKTIDVYRQIFLVDRHVSQRAARALARWVERGGTLVVSAGAGFRDELDRPAKVLEKLVGAEELKLEVDTSLALEKQDLPWAPVLGRVLLKNQAVDIVGARWHLRHNKDTSVELRFEDGEPALLRRRVGKGEVIALAFLPGLSYLRPALPLRPVDRGSREDTLAHLLPTGVSPAIASLLESLSSGLERAAVTSSPLIEAALLEGPSGWLVPVIDWTGAEATEVQVTVPTGPFRRVSLASGHPVHMEERGGKQVASFRVETADALLLR
ncbi:MAG: beta-galactosidase trimerization domain-containing protein, partial [Myxococcales bacterium]|nr:beta-galactosidase trimerization domain-containing protein [Polyangiaceae bacterium]MDW8250150.1 beta-galactosidase trimerization domain-containing protein [Myxococcales bacterium]